MSNSVRSLYPNSTQGEVTLSDTSVVIKDYECSADEVVRAVKGLIAGNSMHNPATAVASLLDMGAMVFQLGSTSADIERMQSMTRTLSQSFEENATDAIKLFTSKVDSLVDPETGLLSRVADETVIKTRDSIGSLFLGAEASVPNEIINKVNEKLDNFSKEMHRIIGQASTTLGNSLSMDSG